MRRTFVEGDVAGREASSGVREARAVRSVGSAKSIDNEDEDCCCCCARDALM